MLRHGSIIQLCTGMAVLLIVASCGWWGPKTAAPPPRALSATASLNGDAKDVIQVLVRDLSPATRIEEIQLFAPDGTALQSSEIRRKSRESGGGGFSRPIIGIGVSGGSKSGVNPSISLDWHYRRDGPDQSSRQAEAFLQLADPAAYRASAQDWHIEIRYTDVTGDQRFLRLPAPLAD